MNKAERTAELRDFLDATYPRCTRCGMHLVVEIEQARGRCEPCQYDHDHPEEGDDNARLPVR